MMRPDLSRYDRVLVAFSGGKDSLAALLHLLDLGVPPERIELHHHDVDGGKAFMDWPCTPAYARALGAAFGVPAYLSWRTGGFAAELGRDSEPTAPIVFETPEGRFGRAGRGPAGGARPLSPGLRRPAAALVQQRLEDRGDGRADPQPAAVPRRRDLGGDRRARRGKPHARPLRAVRPAPDRDPAAADRPLAAAAVLAGGQGVGDHRPLWGHPAPGLWPRVVAGELPQLHLRLAEPMGDAPRPLPRGVPGGSQSGRRRAA